MWAIGQFGVLNLCLGLIKEQIANAFQCQIRTRHRKRFSHQHRFEQIERKLNKALNGLNLLHLYYNNLMHSRKRIDNFTIYLDKMLGEGSFGKVYEGLQENTGLRVAVKMLDKKIIDKDDYFKKALFEEIKILGSLKNENIVKFVDVMESSNYYYIVQQLCLGGDLRKEMDAGAFPEPKAIEYLKQICKGFVEMLKQGIIHRDLKPENILVDKGVLKICDFGFSKRINNKRLKTGTIVGTPLYMSLQILKSEQYTGKCDIWALGFIFYEMLHGVTPWTAKSEYQLIKNIESKPLKISPRVSQPVKSLLESMLRLEQKDRISWDELLLHPVFEGYFNFYLKMNESFQNKMKMIMNELRYVISSSNIDLQRLFASRGYSKNSQLTIEDLRKFLSVVGMTISPEQCRYVFQKIDANDSNSISLGELESVLKSYHIPMKSVIQPRFSKKHSIGSQGEENESTSQLQDQVHKKLLKAFRKLDQKMTNKGIYLHQVYDAYDVNKDGDMTVVELSRILRKLDETFSEEEMRISFDIIDISSNGSISFDEFHQYFCKCVGIAIKAQGGKGW